jgi:glycosyltransferase involved in cell wall biosynthesis
MEVIPLGVDMHDAGNETKPSRDRSMHILYVGRLEKYKGVHLILKALSCLRTERISLSVVGAGSYENELKRLTNALCLQSKVSFIGRASDATLDQLYRKVDALVLPSLFESFGLTILEAMSYGKAVISTNVGVMYDLCRLNQLQSRLVLTLPPDPQDLVKKMRFLLDEPDLVEQIVRKNREILEHNYSWEAICCKIGKLYSSIVGEKVS